RGLKAGLAIDSALARDIKTKIRDALFVDADDWREKVRPHRRLRAEGLPRADQRDQPLSSGMAVTVELKTGARRVFEYTCSPAGRSRLAGDAGEVIPSPAKGRRTTPVSRRVMREKAAKRQTRAWRPRRDGGEGRGPVVRVRAPCKGRH